MIEGLRRRLASQLGSPSGRGGRLIVKVLNRVNASTNQEAVAALEVAAGHHAVDLGFGGGVGLRALLATPAARVTGVETSETALAAARKRFANHARIELVKGSAAQLPLADASVDRLLTVHTLYFWPDPVLGMAEIARVLTPGGRVCVAIQPRETMEGDPLHEHGFTLYGADDLRSLLADAGFTGVDVQERQDRLFGLATR